MDFLCLFINNNILMVVLCNWIVSMYPSSNVVALPIYAWDLVKNTFRTIQITRYSYQAIICSHFTIFCQKYFRNYANQKYSTFQKLSLTWPHLVLMNVKLFDVVHYAKRRFILCCKKIKSEFYECILFYVTR